ncbi:MAG TPA: right-handed parallel beta-helix repeat-containing protein [Gemmatimonadales bacterium]
MLACGGSPANPADPNPPGPPPGPTPEPPGPTPEPPGPDLCRSDRACPGDDLQAKLDSLPPGATLVLSAGYYRMQFLQPKASQILQGEPGAILSGARELTGWQREGAVWVVGNQIQGGTEGPGECLDDHPYCRYPEDLFVDDSIQTVVGSVAEVAPGRWFFDYDADRIYLGTDPSGRRVETSVTARGIGGTAPGVQVRGLIIEKFASPGQGSAIHAGGDGWTVADNVIRWNHGTGLRGGKRGFFLRNHILANGQMGIGGSVQDGLVVEDNEIAWNNTARYDDGWESGGTKFTSTDGLTVRNNWVHHNFGPGLWTDIDNVNVLIEGNTIEDNGAYGIQHEISYAAVIRNNIVRRNGGSAGYGRCDGTSSCAGIAVHNSRDVEIVGNALTDNFNGIVLLEDDRGSGVLGPWQTRNVWVHDNVVSQSRSGSIAGGIRVRVNQNIVYTPAGGLRWTGNKYELEGSGRYFLWLGSEVTDSEWRDVGHDVDGQIERLP